MVCFFFFFVVLKSLPEMKKAVFWRKGEHVVQFSHRPSFQHFGNVRYFSSILAKLEFLFSLPGKLWSVGCALQPSGWHGGDLPSSSSSPAGARQCSRAFCAIPVSPGSGDLPPWYCASRGFCKNTLLESWLRSSPLAMHYFFFFKSAHL